MRKEAAVTVLLACLSGQRAEARFLVTDADQIDPEERLGTMSFIDHLTYLYPEPYDDLWDEHDVGFRASAGSLTASRFDFMEDVKLQTDLEARAGIAYFESRDEDMLEQRAERELRAWAQLGATPVRLALLGDGGTFKEYGDLGLAVDLWRDRRHWLEVSYWSVDHYYEEKKSNPEDSRPQKTVSPGVSGDWTVDRLRLRFAAEVDTPLRWVRPSHGYVYEYERRTAFARSDYDLGDGLDLALSGSYEWKREAKTESLRRTDGWADLRLIRTEGGTYDTLGLLYVSRDAHETPRPASVRRREVGLRGLRFVPLSSPDQSLQYGLFVNGVDLRMDTFYRHQLESKAELAWDYAFGPKAHMLLNTTWDLGKIARGTRPFRPWGGGNLQLIATF